MASTPDRVDEILRRTKVWLERDVGCIPARVATSKSLLRLVVVTAAPRSNEANAQVTSAFASLLEEMSAFRASGAMLIFDDDDVRELVDTASLQEMIRAIGARISPLSDVDVNELIDQTQTLRKTVAVRCPLSEREALFDDLDVNPFCPQAGRTSDAHYNPSIEAPFPCVSMISDVYAICLAAREACLKHYGKTPLEINDLAALEPLFEQLFAVWQRLGEGTMRAYAERTDATKGCPIRMTPGGSHWIGPHEDGNFFNWQRPPLMYSNEMALSYTPRIREQWRAFFTRGATPDYRNMTRPGVVIPTTNAPPECPAPYRGIRGSTM